MEGHVSFCQATGAFTPIYDANPERSFVSVNAGDHALYVGGGSINLAFARAFQASGIREDVFLPLHTEAFKAAGKATGGCLLDHPETLAPSVTFCYARTAPPIQGQPATNGLAILDVWKPTKLGPFRDERNCAMLYVVGPRGKLSTLADFLKQVEMTGENLMRTITEANALLGDRSRDVMRVCAISSGVYKHRDATKIQVANALLSGMERAYEPCTSPDVEFAYDEDAFREAWQARQ